DVAHARRFRRGEFQAVALVVVPAAQISGVAVLAGDRHAHHVDEEAEALVELWGHHFEVAEMRDVVDWLRLQGRARDWGRFAIAIKARAPFLSKAGSHAATRGIRPVIRRLFERFAAPSLRCFGPPAGLDWW